jgi:RimJ/RimL family protein N-acetyltransferase
VKAGSAPDALATPRLTLRRPVEADFPDMLALWSDPDLLRFIDRTATHAEIWARLLKYVGHWSLFGFGYWMLREAGSGRFVGEISLSHQRRIDMPAAGDAPETGWMLASTAQGRGLAGEALGAVLGWADAHLPAARTTCLIDPQNTASIRLATAQGYRRIGPLTLNGASTDLFERIAPAGD